ncbi:hypothetical protein [Actinocorallia populi]|uniref:hypothetical protein n=1 Tax=Actinocorallia populi TaxID=2079200 RepID=UPI0013003CD2|nr:hypothetical protein [Actinocorallia populi]
MRRRSPQEKKRLSYARDRRNDYGENDKSSRSAVRLNKRFPHRANRVLVRQDLRTASGILDPDRGSAAESTLLARRPKSWRKVPDRSLGDHVEAALARRISKEKADTSSRHRLAEVRAQRRSHRRRAGKATLTYSGTWPQNW